MFQILGSDSATVVQKKVEQRPGVSLLAGVGASSFHFCLEAELSQASGSNCKCRGNWIPGALSPFPSKISL